MLCLHKTRHSWRKRPGGLWPGIYLPDEVTNLDGHMPVFNAVAGRRRDRSMWTGPANAGMTEPQSAELNLASNFAFRGHTFPWSSHFGPRKVSSADGLFLEHRRLMFLPIAADVTQLRP